MLRELKREVCRANKELARLKLAPLTFGNVSGIWREKGIVVIKPSGISYEALTPANMAVVDLDGNPVEGKSQPSTDLPSHLALYQAWPEIGGVAHTHSLHATMFAQAQRPLPCLGTTHADYFKGDVPLTRPLTPREIQTAYEANTGRVIIERFRGIDPLEIPAVLVIHHGPFTWGKTPDEALHHSHVLELAARLALGALTLNPRAKSIPRALLAKHYPRKHGPQAYYGQSPAKQGRKK
jgi:L-ribulose-5-phosphate 4-epimerase